MAIGRLQASLAQATNEVTVAAANINFDFTLVKCEAPKEYHGLGSTLSRKRKFEAETGQAHITARRLGALFEGICPATPNLIKAYGLRASEIAAKAKDKFSEPSNSIFAEQSGIDGTSIWAAATSSPAAMHVQLLACMLARIFDAQQATSIWYELVKDRKGEIAGKYESGETLRFATLTAAAQSEISRSSLADWDASARAWLRTADKVKNHAQQQLMLIIANINIQVSRDMMVFPSVIPAWRSAIESMEKLIGGMPHAANTGPPLLALSSWHLYPDLLAVGEKEVHVRFDDPLVSAGGRLTIGLDTLGEEGRGIHWSLSLAHLKFYGCPEISSGEYDMAPRLTFLQFTYAVFGTVVASWNMPPSSVKSVAQFFVTVEDFLVAAPEKGHAGTNTQARLREFSSDRSHWWKLLTVPARTLLSGTRDERDEVQRLINLGFRRSAAFQPSRGQSRRPFFGLCDPSVLLRLMHSSHDRISFLRSIVERSHNPLDVAAAAQTSLIIRDCISPRGAAQYATLLRLPRDPPHHRWITNQSLHVDGESSSLIFNHDPIEVKRSHREYCFTDISSGSIHNVVSIFGDEYTASICQSPAAPRQPIPPLTLEMVMSCLKDELISAPALLDHLDISLDPLDNLNATMRAMSAAFTFYRSLPDATLGIEVLNRPFTAASWTHGASDRNRLQPRMDLIKLDRCTAFSCVAYMEACADLSPESFGSVFSLAYEDSLYIAMQLVCDPFEVPLEFELRRVLGNVGRPGITLLIPPTTQMVRPVDPSSWKVTSTTKFNSLPENHFGPTSLHLSFTEYYVPVHRPGQQTQDNQIFYLESYVSIHDRGKWIGDIDILQALANPRLTRGRPQCSHSRGDPPKSDQSEIDTELLSAESWHDILDPPEEAFVVRAHGSWIARLAASSMVMQILPENVMQGIVICGSDFCWPCELETQPRLHNQQSFAIDENSCISGLGRRAYID